jgi:hypothetical protein
VTIYEGQVFVVIPAQAGIQEPEKIKKEMQGAIGNHDSDFGRADS